MKEDMEKAYAKRRMELRNEEEEELNRELTEPVIRTEEDKEQEERNRELEAKTRQIFDPIENNLQVVRNSK